MKVTFVSSFFDLFVKLTLNVVALSLHRKHWARPSEVEEGRDYLVLSASSSAPHDGWCRAGMWFANCVTLKT